MAYLGERILANFRKRGPREKRPSQRSKRPGMSDDHLTCIRQMPCCACLRMPAGEAHHLKAGTGERGAGMRSSDKWAVPLCRNHHDEIERAGSRNEPGIFKLWRIEPLLLADALWHSTGNVAAMTKILFAHKGAER